MEEDSTLCTEKVPDLHLCNSLHISRVSVVHACAFTAFIDPTEETGLSPGCLSIIHGSYAQYVRHFVATASSACCMTKSPQIKLSA